MKNIFFIFCLIFLSCDTNKKTQLNENESKMILQLNEIKNENKFIEGSNGWDGYSGCKNLEEKNAYSKNIENLIDELIKSIEDKKDKTNFEKIIEKYNIEAERLGEKFRADTDENEMNYLYFDRIRRIITG